MATEGGRISPPGCWGGSRPPPVAGSFFFLFAEKVTGGRRRMAVVGGVHGRRLTMGYLFGGWICWLGVLILLLVCAIFLNG
jgi:hypothetical protein